MNKSVINTALALLMSLGVAACSSGGSGASGASDLQPVDDSAPKANERKQFNNNSTQGADGYTTVTSVSDAAKQAQEQKAAEAAEKQKQEAAKKAEEEAKKAEENAKKAEEQRKAEEERKRQAEEEQQKLTEAEKAARAQADKISSNLATGYFVQKQGSQAQGYLADSAKKAALLEQTGRIDTVKGTSATANAIDAKNGAALGDLLLSKKQSYTGYAVIREEYNPNNKQVNPVNSYIAIVTTPTTDKKAVVDATYKGTAVYTTKNANTVTGYTNNAGANVGVSLQVTDAKIAGSINRMTGKKDTALVTFSEAAIQQGNDGVVFAGEAIFHKAIGVAEGVTGTYQGQFGGANAEEVVGTFESATSEKDSSVQGAFMASKSE